MTATDPTFAGLLRAVLEWPDDDVPRLVAADWLEENGEPERAEFIRVQVELARLESACACEPLKVIPGAGRSEGKLCDPCVEAIALRRRERELWNRHGLGFITGLPGEMPAIHMGGRVTAGVGASIEYQFRRGFIEAVSCDLATLMGGPCGRCVGRGFATRPSGTGDSDCDACSGTGRTPGIAPRLFASQPVTRVTLTDAVVHPSGGNDTYYLGGLGHFPSEYWRSLENLPSRRAVMDATSAVCVAYGRANAEAHWHEVVCRSCSGEGCNFKGHGDPKQFCDGSGRVRRAGLPPLARGGAAVVVSRVGR